MTDQLKDFVSTYQKSREKCCVIVFEGTNSRKYLYELKRIKRNQIFKK